MTSLLLRDLTPEQLAAVRVLASMEALLIDGPTDDEYDGVISALSSPDRHCLRVGGSAGGQTSG